MTSLARIYLSGIPKPIFHRGAKIFGVLKSMIIKRHVTKLLLLLVAASSMTVSGCTSRLVDSMKGDYVYASLNALPVTVTKAWDDGLHIVICIYRTDNPRKSYNGDAIEIEHPFLHRYMIEKMKIKKPLPDQGKRNYVFSKDTLVYKANLIANKGCLAHSYKPQIPVVEIEEMSRKGFVNKNKRAVYYQMKDNRIVSLGYFSAEKMFNQYQNLNIDLTGARTIIGRSGGNPLVAIFLPVTAAVDVVAGTVAFGAMAPCIAAGCK